MAACGQFPEPATEQPLLSAWVAERYAAELLAAEIVKINSYSDQFEKPIYVEMRDNVPIYFPWEPVGLISPMRCDQKSA